MGIAFTNTADFEVTVELRALDPSGELITGADILNPATLLVPPRGQTWALVEDVFGVDILSAGLKRISFQSHSAAVGTLFLIGNQESTLLGGGTARQTPLKAFVLPSISREGEFPFTTVHLFNPSVDSDLEVELTLFDLSGKVIVSRTVTLLPQGTVVQDLATLLEVELAMFRGGYLEGSAGAKVWLPLKPSEPSRA